MATWDITAPAGTDVTGTSGNNTGITPPGDFDDATINSVTLINAPTLTSNESSNDSFWIRWYIATSGGTDVYGGTGADADSLSFINDSFSNINSGLVTVALGSATTPAPTTAVAADWATLRWAWNYTVSGKDDASTCSWAAYTIRVDYTPSVTAAVLTLPTEADITQTSATVGCTTDTAAGTLYWYVSTSATAPTAANLKDGTGSVDFGNIASPGVGTETFSASGLTYNTNYYTYFIQNNGADSNILESGIWTTLDAASDSETFAITTDEARVNTATRPGVETFTVTVDEGSTNLKTAVAAISYNSQLNKILSQYKLTDESISLLVNLDYNASVSFPAAISFIVSLAEQESNTKTATASINLQGTLDFILSNVLTGAKSITLGTLLDKVLTENKITSETQTLATTLDFNAIGGRSIAGTSTFGVTAAYAVSNYKAVLAQMNAGIILSEASQISKLLAEAISFSYTLTFAEDLSDIGILDDPVYSAGNYIFVDLANVLASGTGVVAGSITFANSLGQQQTVGLTGLAAVTLLTTLAMQDITTKITDKTETFAIQMDQNLDFARLLTFTAGLDLDILPAASTDILRSILYSISSDFSGSTVKQTDKTLTFATQLNEELLKQLTANLSISFDTTLEHILAVQADLNEAITYLTTLNATFQGDTGLTGSITFAIDSLQTLQVQQILNPTLTLLTNLSQNEQRSVVTSETIAFLTDLLQQQTGFIGVAGAVTFAAQLNDIETNTLTVDRAFELLINLAEDTGVQLDKVETITLLIQLADTYSNVRSVPGSILFNTNLDYVPTNLLDKLATIVLTSSLQHVQTKTLDSNETIALIVNLAEAESVTLTKEDTISLTLLLDHNFVNIKDVTEAISLNTNLDYLSTNLLTKVASVIFNSSLNQQTNVQVDFNTAVTFANILAEQYLGNTTGAIEAAVTFALNTTQGSVGISTLFDSISFDSLLGLTGIGGRNLLDSIEISAQFGDSAVFNMTKSGAVNLQTFYNKLDTTRLDYRPSIDFDLQAIEGSVGNRNMLASMLLDMEADLITDATRTLPVLINYGITQNQETELQMILEGTITMTTVMAESSTLQMLGQVGITFGHILGLSALSSADFTESISFGTITDFSADGFVIQFTVNTPDGRILKIYFEDRITIVDEENRILKVYKDPSTTIN